MVKIGLPASIIGKFFSDREQRDSLDKILDNLDPNKEFSIIEDRQLLEELYVDLNPHNLFKKSFRYTILSSASQHQTEKFLKTIGIVNSFPLDKRKRDSVLNDASKFKWANNKETRAFIEAFDLPASLIPAIDDIEPSFEKLVGAEKYYKRLLVYQTQVLYKALRELPTPSARFIIQLPTGAGKTKVAMEMVSDFLDQNAQSTVVWLVDRTELCRQAVETFKETWQHIGRGEINLYRVWETHNVPSGLKQPALVVSTISKIINYRKRARNPILADLIIFDEAHHAAATEYSRAISFLSGNDTKVVGLTATPGRSYTQEMENRKLAELFHDTILKIDTPDPSSGVIKYLQDEGVLARAIKRAPIEFESPDFKLTDEDWKKIAIGNDYDIGLLKKLGRSYLRNLKIAQEIVNLGKENKQVLYFGTDVSQSRLMFGVAKYFGYKGAHIDASTPASYRKDMVTKFKSKEISFIFNYDVFSAGFDAPGVDVVFIARPTKSPIVLLQMIGRGMRGPLMGGKEEFELAYVKDKFLDQFVSLDELFEIFDDYFGERL